MIVDKRVQPFLHSAYLKVELEHASRRCCAETSERGESLNQQFHMVFVVCKRAYSLQHLGLAGMDVTVQC